MKEAIKKKLFQRKVGTILFAALIATYFFRPLIIAILLVIIGGVSTIYKRYISIGIDLELCSLCAVAIGAHFGALEGAIAGAASITLALTLNGHIALNPFFAAIKMLIFAGLGIVAAMFAGSHLIIAAAIFTIIADLFFVTIALRTGGNAGNLSIFLMTHIFFVIFQLRMFLPITKQLMG